MADELCVIADEKTPDRGFDLKLSDAAEDLLWLAMTVGVKTRYFFVDGSQLWNPDTSLNRRGVPERAVTQQAQRTAFMRQLSEIRLDCDYTSSGLWDEGGRMLAYELLDLPFPLVRRIAEWQRDFDETLNPPQDMGDDAWWARHLRQELDLAKDLQAALGDRPVVKLFRREAWRTVEEIRQLGGEQM